MAKRKQITTTVLIADDEAKVRSALRFWLNRQAGIQVLGEAVDVTGVRDWVRVACPDALLLDWELPGQAAAGLVADLRCACPDLAIVALSGRAEAQTEAKAARVDFFVSKADPPEQLLSVLERLQGWPIDSTSDG